MIVVVLNKKSMKPLYFGLCGLIQEEEFISLSMVRGECVVRHFVFSCGSLVESKDQQSRIRLRSSKKGHINTLIRGFKCIGFCVKFDFKVNQYES